MAFPDRMLNVITKCLTNSNKEKESYVFRGQLIENDTEVNDTQAIEYEFVNLGLATVVLNNNIVIPGITTNGVFAGAVLINRWKGVVNKNETDKTIYKVSFKK